MQDLNVALIQEDLVWQDPTANRNLFADRLAQLGSADLVVLPEMFTTGFTMAAAQHCEPMAGPTLTWMRDQARRYGFTLAGSVIIEDSGRYFNRLVLADAGGGLQWYDKRHLFRMADEHSHFAPGQQRVIAGLAGWRVALQVCYDLRFPVFSRNRDDYDVLLYVANWPAARQTAWDTLLRARAMENLSYCVGVNRVGTDGAGITYQGGSVILDFVGAPLASAGQDVGVVQAQLSMDRLLRFRSKFPAHLDADEFRLGGPD